MQKNGGVGGVRKLQAGTNMLGLVVVVVFAVPVMSRRGDYFWSAGSPNNPPWCCYKFIL